jgi:hypothetical protein
LRIISLSGERLIASSRSKAEAAYWPFGFPPFDPIVGSERAFAERESFNVACDGVLPVKPDGYQRSRDFSG